MLYFIIFSFFAIMIILDNRKIAIPLQKIIILYSFLTFWLMSGLRWRTGTDWVAYHDYFVYRNTYKDFMNYLSFEYGFKLLNWLVKSFTSSYSFFLLLQGFFIISLKYLRLLKDSNFIIFSILIYFASFLGDIFFVRQSIAISICVYWGIHFIKEQKFIPFMLIIFIATLFHSSAVAFIILYFLNKKVNFLLLNSILAISIIVGMTGILNSVISALLSAFSIPPFIAERLLNYGDNEVSYGMRNIIKMFDRLFIVIFILLCYKRIKINTSMQLYVNMFYLSVITFFMFTGSLDIFVRFSLMFRFSEVILVPYLISNFKYIEVRIILTIIFLFYYCLKLYNILMGYWDLFVPYGNVVFKFERILY